MRLRPGATSIMMYLLLHASSIGIDVSELLKAGGVKC
jgi:hypothetical protein